MIGDLISFINVGKPMNPSQVTETARLIKQCFFNLNLADLKLFFERMKLGYYGKFYDRMDGQIILEKMEEYNQERMSEHQYMSDNVSGVHRREENTVREFHPTVVEVLKKAIGDKKVFTPDIKHPKTPTDAELFHQRCLKQFDNLFVRFGVDRGIRALKIGNTLFTIDTFINRKIENVINKQTK